MRNKTFLIRITRIGVFTAMALIMHFVESMLPPLLAFAPGAKIGLSNVVTLAAIILLGYFDAAVVLFVRCLLASLYGGNLFGLVYSLSGGLSAYIFMVVMYALVYPKISLVGISLGGAVIHNVVQTLLAAAIVRQINLVLILPLMLTASCAAGILIGLTVHYLIKYLPVNSLFKDTKQPPPKDIDRLFGSSEPQAASNIIDEKTGC